MSKPVIEHHNGICVVRDDLYEGGTKARIFEKLYSQHDEIVYGCAATSKTQISLARVAKKLNKKATIFLPDRKEQTQETQVARDLGADIHEVRPGYLSVIQKAVGSYAANAYLRGGSIYRASLGFDTPEVIKGLADVARQVEFEPDEVWCAAGSGVLTRSLQLAWPNVKHFAVQVGKQCNIGQANRLVFPMKFEQKYEGPVPFDSERHFDAKAWVTCLAAAARLHKKVLFWNVLGE